MNTMIKNILIGSLLALGMASCDVNLPGIGVETDLEKIPLPSSGELLIPLKDNNVPMRHCGALHTPEDFARIKQNLNYSPWKEGYEKLVNSQLAQLSVSPNAQESIIRGDNGTDAENYAIAFRAVASAYQCALRWKISDDEAYAKKSVEILNAWANTCKRISGNSDACLAAGIYGYQFAVVGELMRDYSGWSQEDQDKYHNWMLTLWYPMNSDFLTRHNGTPDGHYWANWGLCNIASMAAIGILCDRRDIYNEAIEHFQTGKTNGNINKAIYHVFDGEYANYAQWQESNRDRGHTLLCQGLMGVIMQLTWNQGDDFFSYKDNMFLKACEYTAAYDFGGQQVPNISYTREYKGPWGTATEEYPNIHEQGSIDVPIWALPYYHYAKISGVEESKMSFVKATALSVAPEGGGGNYGGNSGGFDNLGFGTLMYAQ